MQIVEDKYEISLLDLLLVFAENFKLLILGPVVAALLALAVGYVLPESFTSEAILALPASVPVPSTTQTPTPTQAAAMMVSPLVLDAVVQTLRLTPEHTIEGARTELAKHIKATVGKDGLLRLDATANTPGEAQKIANAIIDIWLKSTTPGEKDREDLEMRLIYAKTSLEAVRRLQDRLTGDDSAALNKPLTLGGANISIVAIGELQARYQVEVLGIPRLLQGLSRDVVIQPPTLPIEPVAPRKKLITVVATLFSSLLLLLWVFMRQAWTKAARDPEVAEKQAKLLAALGFSGRLGR